MSLFDLFRPGAASDPAAAEAHERRHAAIMAGLKDGTVPAPIRERLEAARGGRLPWTATLSPAELLIARSHGLKPIASLSATCWMHYGQSWTLGHQAGWHTALERLRAEAVAAGANAVVDVKMRTLPLALGASMDFTLVGTAVSVDGLQPSPEPIVATVPALELVKLLEADVVPTGLAVGAHYQWLSDWGDFAAKSGMGNTEADRLSRFWNGLRTTAHDELRRNAQPQGNGVLAHVNFSQLIKQEGDDDKPTRYLGRHIVVATTVDSRRGVPFRHEITPVVDVHAGATPLTGAPRHHQSYDTREREGAI
jgi:hypothetical protein